MRSCSGCEKWDVRPLLRNNNTKLLNKGISRGEGAREISLSTDSAGTERGDCRLQNSKMRFKISHQSLDGRQRGGCGCFEVNSA